MKIKLTLILFVLFFYSITYAQVKFDADTVKSKPFDNGKMWTFDNPPLDYFEKTYGFKPSQEWLNDVQMSALRFATYCSASFVSSDGLVMTNHHCARESGTSVALKGEDLNNTGFYAKSLKDERKVNGLFVDQLVLIKDVSATILNAMKIGKTDVEQVKIKDSLIISLQKSYADSIRWKGLELQIVTFYKGGQFSLYGFKRHKDVRLVFMPELQMGFFGGDPDNFTYPRYALDCSFFRVYDESGIPLTTKHFFKFNPNGAKEGEPVFVVGNPGKTERLSTKSQLDFFRDVIYPATLTYIRNRSNALKKYNLEAKSDSVLNLIFSLENSYKAISGMLKGLQDDMIYARKMAFEKEFTAKVRSMKDATNNLKVWDDIATCRFELRKVFNDYYVLQPREINPKSVDAARLLFQYFSPESDSLLKSKLKKQLLTLNPNPLILEKELLKNLFNELVKINGEKERILIQLKVHSVDEAVDVVLKSDFFKSANFTSSCLKLTLNDLELSNDPLLNLGKILNERFLKSKTAYDSLIKKEVVLNAKLAQLFFSVYGKSTPPDATFSLRIADGIVKGYEYNGTTAPYKTTFYGLYDRYYSFDTKFPFSLPDKWKNPTAEFLKSPYNFVSTNDIIGGNSGSAIININKEAVGLIFDGNIESLPGRFIYTDEANRTVSVHSGGILAALKYIYKANRLTEELLK